MSATAINLENDDKNSHTAVTDDYLKNMVHPSTSRVWYEALWATVALAHEVVVIA
jgi:hypothetical protein